MSSHVKDGRVTKKKANAAHQVNSAIKAFRHKTPKVSKPLPLVERTNQLSLDRFISAYVPESQLEIRPPQSTSKETQDTNTNTGANANEKKTIYKLDIYTAATIPDADFEACFSLVELMSDDYVHSVWGWHPSKKRKEMKLPDMKYLILRQALEGEDDAAEDSRQWQVVGFCSFMVTYEDGYEVIYLYEINLSDSAQGKGLGKQMILKVEEIGNRVGLAKIMLTVFKSNTTAMKLYDRVGYEVDDFSPPPKVLRNGTVKHCDYSILSKKLWSWKH